MKFEYISFYSKIEFWQKKMHDHFTIYKIRIYTPSGKDYTTNYGIEVLGFGFYSHIPSFIIEPLWVINKISGRK